MYFSIYFHVVISFIFWMFRLNMLSFKLLHFHNIVEILKSVGKLIKHPIPRIAEMMMSSHY